LFKPALVRGKALTEQRGDCMNTDVIRKLKDMGRHAPKCRQFPVAPHLAQIPFGSSQGPRIARLLVLAYADWFFLVPHPAPAPMCQELPSSRCKGHRIFRRGAMQSPRVFPRVYFATD
jgi:hypothetical protein